MPLDPNFLKAIKGSEDEIEKNLGLKPVIIDEGSVSTRSLPIITIRPGLGRRFISSVLGLGGILKDPSIPPPETGPEIAADISGELLGFLPTAIVAGGPASMVIKGTSLAAKLSRMAVTGGTFGAMVGAAKAGRGEIPPEAVGKEVIFDAMAFAAADAAFIGLTKVYRATARSFRQRRLNRLQAQRVMDNVTKESSAVVETETAIAETVVQMRQSGEIPKNLQFPRTRIEPELGGIPDEVQSIVNKASSALIAKNGAITIKLANPTKDGPIIDGFIKQQSKGNTKIARQIRLRMLDNRQNFLKDLEKSRVEVPPESDLATTNPEDALKAAAARELGQPSLSAPLIEKPPTAAEQLPKFEPEIPSKQPSELFSGFNLDEGTAVRLLDKRFPNGKSDQIFVIKQVHKPELKPRVTNAQEFARRQQGFVTIENELGETSEIPYEAFLRSVASVENLAINKDLITDGLMNQFSIAAGRATKAEVMFGEKPVPGKSALFDILEGKRLSVPQDEPITIVVGKRDPKEITLIPGRLFSRIRETKEAIDDIAIQLRDKGTLTGAVTRDREIIVKGRGPKAVQRAVEDAEDSVLTSVPNSTNIKSTTILDTVPGKKIPKIIRVSVNTKRMFQKSEIAELELKKKTLQKKRFALLNTIDQLKESIPESHLRILRADIVEFFGKQPTSTAGLRIPRTPQLTRLTPRQREQMHPDVLELDDALVKARLEIPEQQIITAEDLEFLITRNTGQSAKDIIEMGLIKNNADLLGLSGNVLTPNGFRSRFHMVSYLNLQNVRPIEVKKAEESLVAAVRTLMDKEIPIPDDVVALMRNFSGGDSLFESAKALDFLVKVKVTDNPVDYIANLFDGRLAKRVALTIGEDIGKNIEKTTNVSSISEKLVAKDILKRFRKMNLEDIPEGTPFFGKRGKGARHEFVKQDLGEGGRLRIVLKDPQGNLLFVRPDKFKLNFSPLSLC